MNIQKINANSNMYIIGNILIDTGERSFLDYIKSQIPDTKKIQLVLFTHLHYDHIGSVDLFPNAKFYAHKDEIESYKKDPRGTILFTDLIKEFNIILNPLPETIAGFKVIHTPGHTKGSVCFLKDGNLFSGDTLFFNNNIGRLDLPTSVPELMESSLKKIPPYKNLYPGHDY